MNSEFDPHSEIDRVLSDIKQKSAHTSSPAPSKKAAHKNKFFVPIMIVLSCLSFLWVLFNVNPSYGAVASGTGAGDKINLVNQLELYINNTASDALGNLAYIKKIYTIEESATVAPKPNEACYGRTTNPQDIQAVIDAAEELLDGQEIVAWNPNAEFLPGSEIRYYLDDTILVIAWKEIIDDKVCTCAEVKIAHGSQLRRKITDDSYGSSVQMKASDMAVQTNSVIAINGDFYAFRDLGITAYQRKVYRCFPMHVQSCFFTADGDMLFSHSGELSNKDDAQAFVDENDVTFAIAFGPVLVDNGEKEKLTGYPIGEVNDTYSRAAIGLLDDLHYFLMNINYDTGYTVTATIYELRDIMYDKGCQKAYTLDGGQTSVMVMQGETVNKVDWGIEREMSDIIYFATAIPEGEA